MRKKSHVSLGRYLAYDMDCAELFRHRKAFILGNALPDCKPSFVTTKHEFEETAAAVFGAIERLVLLDEKYEENDRAFCRDLGQVIHYLADYFTYPHNAHFKGNLKDHCMYEKQLKNQLGAYIRGGYQAEAFPQLAEVHTPGSLCQYIRKMHEEYCRLPASVELDCQYIITVCYQVAAMVMELSYQQRRMRYPVGVMV